jgi:hypothetical protein
MLKVLDVKSWTKHKNYPWMLGAALCGTAMLFMLLIYIITPNHLFVWSVVGIELLLYMLLNAFSCLLVPELWPFIKKTILVYLINLVLLGVLLYTLLGKDFAEYSGNLAAFGALVFCFFASLILISFIRATANFLKNE